MRFSWDTLVPIFGFIFFTEFFLRIILLYIELIFSGSWIMFVLLIIIILFLWPAKSFLLNNSFNDNKFLFDSDLDAVLLFFWLLLILLKSFDFPIWYLFTLFIFCVSSFLDFSSKLFCLFSFEQLLLVIFLYNLSLKLKASLPSIHFCFSK